MKKIVFLVSGRGGTLIFINEALKLLNLPFTIVGVIGDRECYALTYAKNSGIFSRKIKYTKENNSELKDRLLQLEPDIVITNFHKIIGEEIINLSQIKFLNLHYSLLPSFAGLIGMKTIEVAKAKNSKFIGTTVHYVDEIVDNGKIIGQTCISVNWENSILIEDTIFKSGCLNLLNAILIEEKTERKKQYNSVKLNNYEVMFSPEIIFKTTEINNDFWEKIKTLII